MLVSAKGISVRDRVIYIDSVITPVEVLAERPLTQCSIIPAHIHPVAVKTAAGPVQGLARRQLSGHAVSLLFDPIGL